MELVHDSEIPVIMFSGQDQDEEVVRGLALGADDYVTKPFSVKQLTARMKAVLRRCQSDPYRQVVNEIKVGNLKLDL